MPSETDFSKCPRYKKAQNIEAQTAEMHSILGVMIETLKWHKVIGYTGLVALVILGSFTLVEARTNTQLYTKLISSQEFLTLTLSKQAKTQLIQDKSMSETTLINLNLTLDYMHKMMEYEKNSKNNERNIKNLEKMIINVQKLLKKANGHRYYLAKEAKER